MATEQKQETGHTNDMAASPLDLLKAYIDSAERNIDRRGETNRFFQTVFSGLIGVLIVASSGNFDLFLTSDGEVNMPVVATLAAFTGIMGWFWAGQLESHRELSEAKYAVILELERSLGVSAYRLEHKYFKDKGWKYTMTNRELLVPRTLMIGGLILLVFSIFVVLKPYVPVV